MKSIVIYNSQTGFTKKYAEWISEAAACEYKCCQRDDCNAFDFHGLFLSVVP